MISGFIPADPPRAAFSNVLHVDIAFPLNATADVKKVQFLVKTKTSF